MHHVWLFCAVILFLSEIKGSSAVTHVFVQKGNDVLLDVKEADVPKDFLAFQLLFNTKTSLVTFKPNSEPKVIGDYNGRVETSVRKYSVTLKNLQEADSGVYVAQVTTDEGQRQIVKYNVTVQARVSPVKLKLHPVSNSSDSCNITVTCSTDDFHISSTFSCDTTSCSQEGGRKPVTTTSGASLNVYLLNEVITCNHSNQVSWVNDTRKIEDFCPRPAGSKIHHSRTRDISFGILGGGAALGVITFLAILNKKRGNKQRFNLENTVYAVPEVGQNPPRSRPGDDDSGLSPTSTYSLVGHAGSMGSTETGGGALPASLYEQIETTQTQRPSNDEASGISPTSTYSLVGAHAGSMGSTETREGTLPESLYAQIDKPSKT